MYMYISKNNIFFVNFVKKELYLNVKEVCDELIRHISKD